MPAHAPDQTLLNFLDQGFAVVEPTSLDAAYHEAMWKSADELYDQSRKLESPTAHLEILGDNIRAAVPAIDQMLSDPAVTGAIEAILGPDAFLHPHNFVHESMLRDQPFHQDGNLPWNERGHYRSHRPDWVILFYYPQAVTLDNGPTEVVPHSQYWTTNIERPNGTWRRGDPIDDTQNMGVLGEADLSARDESLAASLESLDIPGLERRFLEVPRGAVVIGNYDLIHRGSRTQVDSAARYMFKFYFARTREPVPTKASETPEGGRSRRADIQPLIDSHWAWHQGRRLRKDIDRKAIDDVIAALDAKQENERIAAAYSLGADSGKESLDALLTGLHAESEGTRRACAYGLRLRCDEAAQELTDACCDDSVSVRRFATFALGAAWSTGWHALVERLETDSDDLTRSNAAYALGQVARSEEAPARDIAQALLDRLAPGTEANNTDVAGLPRSTVRQSAAYGLLQLATTHSLSTDERNQVTQLIDTDEDRYVIGMLLEVIARCSPDGDTIRALAARRWWVAPQLSSKPKIRF